MTQENATTDANPAETFGLRQLVVQLKVLGQLGGAVVDNRGHRINGVKLNGADRAELLQSIASQTGLQIVEFDAKEWAATLSSAPRLNPVKLAFDRATQVSRNSRTPVLLYIRNFEEIGSREATQLPQHVHYDLGAEVLDQLNALDCNDVNNVFVIVSSAAELDLPFSLVGRLPSLELFCAD